jgi:aryl-alcohol dehydrogenase-like predicted oxidoreductase
MPLLTWSSLAGGFFSGRFRPDNLDTFSDEIDQLCVETYCCEANFQRLERAAILARAKGLTLAQVAMAYVMSQPLNIFAIVGCQNGSEFADLALASEIELTTRELAWLDVGGQL